jgi:hypothetical protein
MTQLFPPLLTPANYSFNFLFNPFVFLPQMPFAELTAGVPWVCGEWLGVTGGAGVERG